MSEGLKNIKLILAYDGSRYHGWQRQKNGLTIQEVLEGKIYTMLGERVKLIASGRTDAGVHATHQVCSFVTRSDIAPESIQRGLNSLLPDDLFLTAAAYVPREFHARYSVRSKTYEYRILNQNEPDVFLRNYVWHVRRPLDMAEMARCLALLVGRHDFSSFRSSGSGNSNPVRWVMRAEIQNSENGLLRLIIEADGFLRHMVRNVVGTVVEAGLGKMDFEQFREVFKSRDRRLAGIKAPPQGLFLVMVRY
jgi:tRNA pseudouridine38-40 synthase